MTPAWPPGGHAETTAGSCFPAELYFYAVFSGFCGVLALCLFYLRYREVRVAVGAEGEG